MVQLWLIQLNKQAETNGLIFLPMEDAVGEIEQ